MRTSILLLFSSVFLMMSGHGIQLSALPLHASELGWSEQIISWTASAYFIGFVVGCLTAAKLLAKAGHIRVLTTLFALSAAAALMLETLSSVSLWLLIRFLSGWSLAAIYAASESWVNDQATPRNRARLFGAYVLTTMAGLSLGQLMLSVVPADQLFRTSAVMMLIALVPVGLFCEEFRIEIAESNFQVGMIRWLPTTAVAGVFVVGTVMGCLWALAPLSGQSRGMSTGMIGMMMTAITLGGAAMQLPVGVVADKLGKKPVTIALATFGTAAISALMFLNLSNFEFVVLMAALGATVLPIYTLAAAEANDTHLNRVDTATTLLLMHGLGSVIGPFLAGFLAAYTNGAIFYVIGAVLFAYFVSYPFMRSWAHGEVVYLDALEAENDEASSIDRAA